MYNAYMYNHVLTMRVDTEKILIIHNVRDAPLRAINMLKKVGGLLAPYIPTCTFAAAPNRVLVLLLLLWGEHLGNPQEQSQHGLCNQASLPM